MSFLTRLFVLGGLGAGCAPVVADEDKTETSATEDLANLRFHGFDIDPTIDVFDARAASSGLDHVFAGRGFRNGFPTARIELINRLVGFVQGRPTALDEFTRLGALPSPPSRPLSRDRGPQPALGQSYFDREGAGFSNRNCFLCHAGVSNGLVIAGMGNAHLDQASSLDDLRGLMRHRRAIMAEIRTLTFTHLAEEVEQRELEDFFLNAAITVEPTLRFAEARGDNFGPYAVWSHLTRLADPSNTGLLHLEEDAWTDRDSLFAAQDLATVDPNPWWNRKYRNTSYWYGENAEYIAAHFAFNFTTPHREVNETHPEHVGFISDILAFARQTTSPTFPRQLDAASVQWGMELFHGQRDLAAAPRETLLCAGCHGTYTKIGADFATPGGWVVDYQDQFIDVDTDPQYNQVLRNLAPIAQYGNGLQSFFARRNETHLAPQSIVPSAPGYLAPPLVGVWASAPYFHNGSVPTLYHVLNSQARPAMWTRRNDDPFAYNLDEVGLACSPGYRGTGNDWQSRPDACTSVDMSSWEYDQAIDGLRTGGDPASAVALRAIYATHRIGRFNTGHPFGDRMNDTERYAVIAFLSSLSGPNM